MEVRTEVRCVQQPSRKSVQSDSGSWNLHQRRDMCGQSLGQRGTACERQPDVEPSREPQARRKSEVLPFGMRVMHMGGREEPRVRDVLRTTALMNSQGHLSDTDDGVPQAQSRGAHTLACNRIIWKLC